MKSLNNHSVEAVMVLHVMDEEDYEVLNIGFDESDMPYLVKDRLIELASVDLDDCGDISSDIHKELWNKDKTERFYCIRIALDYADYSDFSYKVVDIKEEWKNLNLLQRGTKIYPIDYEISQKVYTIDSVYEVYDNDFMKTGLYYTISNDALSCLFQKHSLSIDSVDMNTAVGRFFTTPSLAHEAYCYHLQNLNENEEISADEQER